MTKIRIATTQAAPLPKAAVRPWLRYAALVAIAGLAVLLLASPEAERGFETAMRAMVHYAGQ